jgi:hypothetical protein
LSIARFRTLSSDFVRLGEIRREIRNSNTE